MDTYAEHVVALLDHLGIETAVIGGVSLGANVSLLVTAQAPERVEGLVLEMPVLEWAVPAAAITFVPMLLAVHFARPLVRRTASLFRRLPRTGIGALDSVMNSLSNDPVETAAVLHGILAGPIAPTVDQRAAMDVPALVIGHRVDRIHPFHDAEQLARRLPKGRLIQAKSVIELRVHPERLTARSPSSSTRCGNRLPRRTGRSAEPRTAGRELRAIARVWLLLEVRPAIALAFGETALVLQPSLLGPPRRSGGTTGLLDVEGVGHPGAESLHGQLPVAHLGSLVVDHDPYLRSEALEEPGPLPRPERRGSGHVESELDPGAHLVGVLTTGTTAGSEPELQLGRRERQRRR